jgi:O-antigen/teichoic acid export membrane protein
VTVGLSVWLRPPGFPRWPGLEGIGHVFQFSKFASGIYMFGELGRGTPQMVIGKTHDMGSVGVFSRANGLVELFDRLVVRAVLPICMPYFARSQREDGSIVTGYLTGVSFLTVIGWPFLSFMGIVSYAAIRIVYGPQWTASVSLAKILCVAGAIDLSYYFAKEALLSIGDAKRSNILQVGLQLSRVLGLLAAVPFGLTGACWGLCVASVVGAWLSHRSLAATIDLGWKDVARTCRPSLYIAVVATAPVAAWALLEGISEANFVRVGFGGGILTGVSWLIALRLFRHPLFDEIVGVLSRFRMMLMRPRTN